MKTSNFKMYRNLVWYTNYWPSFSKEPEHRFASTFFIIVIYKHWLQFVVFRVVKFTHETVDVGGGVATNVGDEQCDELRWNVVKYRTVHVHLGQDLTWKGGRGIKLDPQNITGHSLAWRWKGVRSWEFMRWEREVATNKIIASLESSTSCWSIQIWNDSSSYCHVS